MVAISALKKHAQSRWNPSTTTLRDLHKLMWRLRTCFIFCWLLLFFCFLILYSLPATFPLRCVQISPLSYRVNVLDVKFHLWSFISSGLVVLTFRSRFSLTGHNLSPTRNLWMQSTVWASEIVYVLCGLGQIGFGISQESPSMRSLSLFLCKRWVQFATPGSLHISQSRAMSEYLERPEAP